MNIIFYLFYEKKFPRLHNIFHLTSVHMYQFNKKELPHALASLFFRSDQLHSYCTRQASSLHLPLARTKFRFQLKTLLCTRPTLWNLLTNSLEQSVSLNMSKNKLKMVLLNRKTKIIWYQTSCLMLIFTGIYLIRTRLLI